MTPSFAQTTPEDRNFLTFAQDIRIGLPPATVVVHLEWLSPEEVAVPRETNMEALVARLALGNPRLPADTLQLERVSVPRSSLAPPYLVHPLMVSPFLAPVTLCYMMHAKADAVEMTQRVAPFLDWLRATTVEPQKGIATLTILDLTNSTMSQRQGIRTILVPPPLYFHSLQDSISRCSSRFICKPWPHLPLPRSRQ